MKAYSYDLAGMYQGETVADESPLEPGVYLVPAQATLTAPPDTWPKNKWPRWNGIAWDLVTKPKMQEQKTPEQKLAEFLASNPDVVKLIDGGANV